MSEGWFQYNDTSLYPDDFYAMLDEVAKHINLSAGQFADENVTNHLLSTVLGYNDITGDFPMDNYDEGVVAGKEKLRHAPTFNEMSLIKTIVLSVMFGISLIVNTATLIQMFRMRRRKSTINTLIMQLVVADLIVTFFCFVTDAVWASTVQWLAGNFMCKFIKFMQLFGFYLSTYIIVIISIDRCMAILDPMSRNQAPKRVRVMIITAWICSALFSLPQTYIFRVRRGPFFEEFYQCVTFGAYTAAWQEPFYSFMSVLLMFVIPLVTMVTAYMLIFCTIAKKSRDLRKEAESEVDSSNKEMLSRGPVRGQLFRKAKVKSLRMTAIIVAVFIICWTPYYVLFISHTFFATSLKDGEKSSYMWIFFFGMANSMVNPMIYGAFHVCARRRKNDRARWHVPPGNCPPQNVYTAQQHASCTQKCRNQSGTGTQCTDVRTAAGNQTTSAHGPMCPIKFRNYNMESSSKKQSMSSNKSSRSGNQNEGSDSQRDGLKLMWNQVAVYPFGYIHKKNEQPYHFSI